MIFFVYVFNIINIVISHGILYQFLQKEKRRVENIEDDAANSGHFVAKKYLRRRINIITNCIKNDTHFAYIFLFTI
jgi:high-affinity nickel permease